MVTNFLRDPILDSENPKIQLDNSWIFSISLYNEFNGLFTEQAVETKAGVNVKAQNLN